MRYTGLDSIEGVPAPKVMTGAEKVWKEHLQRVERKLADTEEERARLLREKEALVADLMRMRASNGLAVRRVNRLEQAILDMPSGDDFLAAIDLDSIEGVPPPKVSPAKIPMTDAALDSMAWVQEAADWVKRQIARTYNLPGGWATWGDDDAETP